MNKTLRVLTVAMFGALMCVIGMFIGSWMTYGHMVGAVEERVIRDVNYNMAEAGVRKYRFQTDNGGTIRMIVKQ